MSIVPHGLPGELIGKQPKANADAVLTDRERQQVQRLFGFPLEFPGAFVTYVRDLVRLEMTAQNVQGLAQRVATVGELKVIAKDLSGAGAALTTYDDTQGRWLYCNGATFASADYPELASFLGSTTLPDQRGQVKWQTTVVAATVVGSVLIKA